MTAHLPAPWTAESITHSGLHKDEQWGFTQIKGPNGELITTLYGTGRDSPCGGEVQRANARIIVAAPRLFEELKALCAAHYECDALAGGNEYMDARSSAQALLKEIRDEP